MRDMSGITEAASQVTLRVLGPMGAARGSKEVPLGGPKQRCVLAMLVAAAPSPVSVDVLAEALYGDDAPERGRRRIQTYVSTLRSLLGDVIIRAGEGWRLDTQLVRVDAQDFEAAIASTDRMRAEEVSSTLDRALSLWVGSPFVELESHGWLDPEIGRLNELRLQALERRIDADLDLGRSAEVIPELATLIAEHPYRETLRARHILALYRAGRQEEALASMAELRRLLVDDLGLDPTPELQDLETRILRHDESLRLGPEPEGVPLRGYRLHEEIGHGSFSVVWRGTQPSVGRDVAVKQIRSELATQPEFIRRFEAEAQLIARVEHPHVVPLIDFWRDPDSAYLVMRLLRGGTLDQALRSGPKSVEETLRIVRQIGGGLAEAHALGIVHRDVTSTNVLLDENGNAFLGDFGIALQGVEPIGTDQVASVASPAYAAPEQLRREPLGPETDVFSLAVVVYECLTGGLPFADSVDAAELVRRQLVEPFPNLAELHPELPDHVAAAIVRATSKNASDRYPSAMDFVAALEGVELSSDPVAAVEQLGNPYKGLRSFEEADALDFFGRERMIAEMLDQLSGDGQAARCMTAVGPSGSGKSSLIRAGLIPALRRGGVEGSQDWFITMMVPGVNPFESLESALLRVAVNPPTTLLHQLRDGPGGILRGVCRTVGDEDQVVLVVLDQMEELFTATPPDRAADFLHGLAVAVSEPDSPLRVVSTLRADYYHRPLVHKQFAPLLKAGGVDITPLTADEIEAATVGPAKRRGLDFEQGLVVRVASEANQQPAPLPLLQYAMSQLVENREGTTLTVRGFDQIGGLAGSVAATAEKLFQAASESEQKAMRRIFGRLVNVDQGSADLRRRARRSDLGDDAATESVVDALGQARLLTFDRDANTRESTVEVAHEALLREWPRLVEWLDEDRVLLGSIAHLAGTTDAWIDGGRQETDLYRGVRLENAQTIHADAPERLRVNDREFVAASTELFDQERIEEHRRVQRLRRLLIGVGVALVVAVLAGAVALQQRGVAQDRSVSASARGLAAQATSLAGTELDTALLLAANAAAIEPSAAVEAGLLSVLNDASFLESVSEVSNLDEGALFGPSAGGVVVVTDDSEDVLSLIHI